MIIPSQDLSETVYDLVGIGFGPSNLTLAVAIDEHNRRAGGRPVRSTFFEKQLSFGWHRGMLIDDATMQVSFLKDLVTMRDPASDFSFLCYLKQRDRLVDFINHKTLFPLRAEFHGYFEWAAARVADQVTYGAEVTSVRPVEVNGEVAWLEVIARTPDDPNQLVACRARNVVVAAGLEPKLPEEAVLSDRVWHNLDLMHRIDDLVDTGARRVLVVGAGQSGAEVVAHLHSRLPEADVYAVFARYGYSPADDSPFANRIFDPAAVDHYFDAPADVQRMLLDYHRNTNYSVVDIDLIEDLYRRVYRERVHGRRRLHIRNASRVTGTQETPEGVVVTVEFLPTGQTETVPCDALIYATGYQPVDIIRLLGDAGSLCERDPEGLPVLMRDYRVRTAPHVNVGIYLQGSTEHSHGIAASLQSTTAIRAGEILASILAGGSATHLPTPAFAATTQRG
ncbi:MAG: lysine N(6)-hydroxylase/L-ornithine N(5)-oxygenase family protein [Pseudonocardiaceae bacterium]